jgi:hypothetical protein
VDETRIDLRRPSPSARDGSAPIRPKANRALQTCSRWSAHSVGIVSAVAFNGQANDSVFAAVISRFQLLGETTSNGSLSEQLPDD